MSTIKVNNLQTASGGSNSTPEEIQQGRAKAWVNFNGTGTIAIRDDYNVSTITDHATGQYTVNFSNTMPNANYAFTGVNSSDGDNGNESIVSQHGGTDPTTSALRIRVTKTSDAGYTDKHRTTVIIFGD